MNKIDLNILEKKAASLFFKNKKKTFNIKQILFFLNVKIDSVYIKDVLRNLHSKKCIIIKDFDKYSYNNNSKFFKGTVARRRRKIIDTLSSEELDADKKELLGFFE